MTQKISKAYQYLFYKLYTSLEKYGDIPFWSEWKAASLLVLLLMSIFYSLILYYTIFINRHSELGGNLIFIFAVFIVLSIINYYIFIHKDKWDQIIKDFKKLPRKRDQIGTVITTIFFLLCIFNIIYAFYLLSQVDWSLYR